MLVTEADGCAFGGGSGAGGGPQAGSAIPSKIAIAPMRHPPSAVRFMRADYSRAQVFGEPQT